MIFPNRLHTNVINLNLLYTEVKGGRSLGKSIVVGGWVHEEGILPQRTRVVTGGLEINSIDQLQLLLN